ncbi:MAG: LytTR family DNA-binding domain-containing protein [Clostridiales bacterium]|nr:LytTR family DNA-binding domain-containing protein [Clostridiales bacterium]
MNIAICDDDKSFRDLLEKHLKNYYDEKSVTLNFFQFSSGEELLEYNILFDLVFLDVEMGKINGIDIGMALKKKNPNNIIFVITSYNSYLDDAFKINAFRFLSKPLNVVRLYKALDDAADLIKNDIIVFYDVESSSDVRIYSKDIIFIEIVKKKTKIVTVKGTYYSNEKISVWKNRLNGISFVCPHSSYITNLNYAIKHTRTQLVLAKMDSDKNIIEKCEISIAPKKQAEIKKMFFYVIERR